ncbi:MAG: hypothetical protein JSS75_07330 [Bacteroidetes bacterium]|nr:hypothetical protein [Bacteroidota bacterium]
MKTPIEPQPVSNTHKEIIGDLNPRLILTGVVTTDSVYVPLQELSGVTIIGRANGSEFMIRGMVHYVQESPEAIISMIERALVQINEMRKKTA